MFISHFSKWKWYKIYFTFYHSIYFKHMLSRTRKTIVTFGVILAVALLAPYILTGNSVAWVAMIFILLSPFLYPLIYLSYYCPRTLVCFYFIPSENEQIEIKKSFNMAEVKNYKLSLNFYDNVLNGQYDALFDTEEYFLIYRTIRKALVYEPLTILVIDKKENRKILGNDDQAFLDFMIPKCKHYVKKR
ncbi:hypothetical protein ACVVIB_13025 [Lactococcus lactis]